MENTIAENAKQLEVIEAVKSHNPALFKSCYAVGYWIWAEFQQRLSQEELAFLKEVGFRWNPTRGLWQNACGVKRKSSSGDPRLKYEVIRFNEN
jgi:hypothetical protein